jgi:LysR family glycine cleavage system transcriptional activator
MNTRNPLPSLDLLKGFEVVARHLSFTKAAAELCVTQSAVSRQIRQLEDHLGVRLFERRTRAVVLTEAGYRYYSDLTPLLKQLGEITRKVTAARAQTHVRVTCTLSFASLWLVPRLAAFQERYPDVHVHVIADNVVRDVERDGFDVAMRYCDNADAGAHAVKLFDETLTPVCSPELARGKLKRLDDLAKFPLIHFNDLEGRVPWLSWDSFLGETNNGGLAEKGAVYFSHYDQAIHAARAGQGIALGRLPVIDTELADGALVAPLLGSVALTMPDRGYWLVASEAHEPTPEARIVLDWLIEEARLSAERMQRKRQVR